MIKNLYLVIENVSSTRIDFRTCFGKTILHVAKYIKAKGSLNYKVLYALYKSQFNKKEETIKETSRKEIFFTTAYNFKSWIQKICHQLENWKKKLKIHFKRVIALENLLTYH